MTHAMDGKLLANCQIITVYCGSRPDWVKKNWRSDLILGIKPANGLPDEIWRRF